jgi:hypothetical protein
MPCRVITAQNAAKFQALIIMEITLSGAQNIQ